MRQHRLKLIILLLFVAILIGLTCAGSGPGSTVAQSIGELTSEAARVRLTEQDTDRTVELHPADRLGVVLEGNPTTGYQWEIDALDESIIKPIGEPEFKPDSDALGSGGEFTFVFEAIAPGQTTLTLIYHRPFEKGVQPLKTFRATVVVQ